MVVPSPSAYSKEAKTRLGRPSSSRDGGRTLAWILLLVVAFVLTAVMVLTRGTHIAPSLLLSLSTSSTSSSCPASPFDMASADSFGFFDDIHEKDWKRLKEQALSDSLYKDPNNPNQNSHAPDEWLYDNVDPMFSCQHVLRVGGRGDGPKFLCDPHRFLKYDDCLIYSIGSEGKYEFEDGLHELFRKHCEIHVFDPQPRYARPTDPKNKNIHYHAWGLSTSYTDPLSRTSAHETLEFFSFPETLEKLGHVGRRIDVFKIDCERCEWISYRDWIDNPLVDIRQIQIEVHAAKEGKMPGNTTFADFFSAFYNHGYVLFSKEANVGPWSLPSGFYFEYSFLKLAPSFFRR